MDRKISNIITYSLVGILSLAIILGTIYFNLPSKKTIPKFNFIDIEGVEHSYLDAKDKFIIVNYWATWCKPCLEELPILSKINTEFKDVFVLGLNYENASYNEIKDFEQRLNINFPLIPNIIENNFNIFPEVEVLPTTHIYGKDGKLIKTEVGIVNIEELRKIFTN